MCSSHKLCWIFSLEMQDDNYPRQYHPILSKLFLPCRDKSRRIIETTGLPYSPTTFRNLLCQGIESPDITGAFSRAYQSRGNQVSGAFAQDGSSLYQETGTNYQVNGLTFKSSRSSSIYGSSTIVQPKSLQHLTIIKA